MKTRLLLFFCLCSFALIGQDSLLISNFPIKTGKINYSGISKVDTSFANTLLIERMQNWCEENFKEKGTLEVSEDLSKMKIKTYLEIPHFYGIVQPKNHFTISVIMKKGRFKYILTDVGYEFMIGEKEYDIPELEKWLKLSTRPNKEAREKTNNTRNAFAIKLNQEFQLINESLVQTLSEYEW